MNYSENSTYGRKTVRKKTYQEKIFKLLIISLLIGIILGCIGSKLVQKNNEQKFGTIEGKEFETSIEWSSGAEIGFVPLDVPMDEELQKFIYCLSYEYNIDFPFVMGLIKTESYFKTDIISKTNDYGLMQINTINHKWLSEKFGFTDFLDPYQNTRAGLFILRNLFEKYEEPLKVLMAYNLGETGAKRLWDKGIFETNYSNSVMKNATEFTAEIERMNKND